MNRFRKVWLRVALFVAALGCCISAIGANAGTTTDTCEPETNARIPRIFLYLDEGTLKISERNAYIEPGDRYIQWKATDGIKFDPVNPIVPDPNFKPKSLDACHVCAGDGSLAQCTKIDHSSGSVQTYSVFFANPPSGVKKKLTLGFDPFIHYK